MGGDVSFERRDRNYDARLDNDLTMNNSASGLSVPLDNLVAISTPFGTDDHDVGCCIGPRLFRQRIDYFRVHSPCLFASRNDHRPGEFAHCAVLEESREHCPVQA